MGYNKMSALDAKAIETEILDKELKKLGEDMRTFKAEVMFFASVGYVNEETGKRLQNHSSCLKKKLDSLMEILKDR